MKSAPTPLKNKPVPPPEEAKKGFRVTAWFKRGEIEEMTRKAIAASEAVDPFAGKVAAETVADDSTATAADHDRLSLMSGATVSMQPLQPASPPAVMEGRMSDAEMIAELGGSRSRLVFGACAIGLVGLVGALVYFLLG